MDDLMAWLREQLDEDERAARAVLVEMWPTLLRSIAGTSVLSHVSRHDPARVLREVEAKRRRLERHQPRIYDDGDAACYHCEETGEAWPCDELRLDLAVYANRPGYRDEWAPADRDVPSEHWGERNDEES